MGEHATSHPSLMSWSSSPHGGSDRSLTMLRASMARSQIATNTLINSRNVTILPLLMLGVASAAEVCACSTAGESRLLACTAGVS